ncbi:(+)-neomenthol dehydrogenase [Melia azedarach]|uniref:(+)-neomenthol dehydrogenase n=1 Tax=Melia azedarach TaxID=155640 RepID=A0ACC1Y983_MELAZ|nr:(+)-neomenthol dehydrogenase [Melia azedarach]
METVTTNKYAVVTGSNKGIGFETVRQLASKGITVVLTARDENKGLEAVEKLKASGLYHNLVLFHKLDVTDPPTILSLAQFIKTQFGKLDILVNNAGITSFQIDKDAFQASGYRVTKGDDEMDWSKIITQDYESSTKCLRTNYYGTKQTCEALLPLLQLSDSPRMVNVSSYASALKGLPEKAKQVLEDVENLTEERIEMVLNDYLKDYEEGEAGNRGWCRFSSGYGLSKAAVNAYTRVLAKRYPKMNVNCVCPGFVKTDINFHSGILTVEEGAESPVRLALLPDGGPTGRFFSCKEEAPF